MKKLILSLLFMPMALAAQTPDAKSIIEKIDKNMTAKTRILNATVVIQGRRGTRTMEQKIWSEGELNSFSEYLAPARDKGTKMLKLDKMLWIYDPTTDRTVQISGHMLRQSVMGSDMSYEDMLEDSKLLDKYTSEITGSEKIGDRDCYVLTLTAKTVDVSYYSRKLWVDKQRYVPLKTELYAKSGKLLKRTVMSDVIQISGRWFPKTMVFKDMLKDGDGTKFIIDNIQFDVPISDYVFSKGSLKK